MSIHIGGTGHCLLSNNERDFIFKALDGGNRIDGRKPYDFRKLQIQISNDGASVTVHLGKTLVAATIAATLEQPVSERPNEGVLRINMEHVSMAAPGYDADSRTPDADQGELQWQLEKAIRDVRAVDLEALCVVPGRKVWKIQLDVRLLDAGGNTTDAAFVAALAALMAFKRPEVSMEQAEDGMHSSVVVHSMEEREALPLGLHQTPLSVTFAIFKDGDHFVVDPSIKEEAAALGSVTVVMNAHNELCLLQKSGGLGLSVSQVMQLVRLASVKVSELSEKLKAALQVHESARVAARVRRRQPQKVAPSSSRSVSVLDSATVTGDSIRAQLGKDLRALELAANAASSSSDDEDQAPAVSETKLGAVAKANSQPEAKLEANASQSSSDEDRHVPIGVLAPPREDTDEMEVEMREVSSDDAVKAEQGADAGLPNGEDTELKQDQYGDIAARIARIAGDNSDKQPASLEKAVKKKRKRQKQAPNGK